MITDICLGTTEPTPTKIIEDDTPALSLQLRVHRQQQNQQNAAEFYFCRDDTWNLCPIQPDFSKDRPLRIAHSKHQPSTCDFTIPDNGGLLNRSNRNSPLNYREDNTTFDPILKAKRKIMFRAGTMCYENLAAGITPTVLQGEDNPITGGTASQLTDDTLGAWVTVSPTTTDPIDIVIDLGSVKQLRNYVIRFLTDHTEEATLPLSVNWGWSTDNVTWHFVKQPRPIGTDAGDWEDDLGVGAKVVEAVRTDIQVSARYVCFRIVPASSDQTIQIDECAVYGGSTVGFIGGSVFVGYIGGSTVPQPDGNITITAIDASKKLIDNNSVRVTPQFGGSLGPIDAGDIIYSLLTGVAFWKGGTGRYNAPFDADEIGWAYGSGAAQFKYPIWQGQSNNMYGYVSELVHTMGYDIPIDRKGVFQLTETPYRQVIPDRVFIADLDGNNDCWALTPHDDDVDLRNKVIVRSGNPTGSNGRTVKLQPNSIAQYGELLTEVDDPVAFDSTTREKIASYILRDYAFRLGTLEGIVKPDFNTKIGSIIGFRAPRRVNLFTNDYTSISDIRRQQLWCIDAVTEVLHAGDWVAEIQCHEYVGLGPNSPINLTATPRVGDDTIIDLAWTAPPDEDVKDYAIYVNDIDEDSFSEDPTYYKGGIGTTFAVTGLTPGTRYWFYVTAIGQNGQESVPSSVVSAVAGGGAGDEDGWTVTDLTATLIGSDVSEGEVTSYQYEILLEFTSPPIPAPDPDDGNYGFKQCEYRMAVDAIPSNPTSRDSWIRLDEWHGPRIPPGKQWNRSDDGFLQLFARFSVPTDLSGHTIYFRMWTWPATHGMNGTAHPSNTCSVDIP